jgi:outer membrane lipoprotein-sorting protein
VKYAATVALGLSLLLSSAVAQDAGKDGELTAGLEILKKADAAAKALKAVQYKAVAKGLGADEARLPKVEGTAVMSGWLNSAPQKFRYEVKVQRPGSSEIEEYSAGSDGNMVYLVDPSKKIAYEDIDPAVLGSNARVVGSVAVRKLLNPEAFADEIKAEKVELKGMATIGDHDCYEVHVHYDKDEGDGVWFFSKKDFLPRRIDRMFPTRNGETGGRQTILTDLVVNPKLDNNAFKLTLPEGFTKTDDFAP